MNCRLLFFTLLITLTISGQNNWQQNADYKIYVDVNVKKNTYSGTQEVLYTNNSLDTLNKVFFHLYFNAFRPESDMAERLSTGDDVNSRFEDDNYLKKTDELKTFIEIIKNEIYS